MHQITKCPNFFLRLYTKMGKWVIYLKQLDEPGEMKKLSRLRGAGGLERQLVR